MMCGIVGLYLKNDRFEADLGALFTPMLIEMTGRGPDSAGVAIYRDPAPSGSFKITVFHPAPSFDWTALSASLRQQFGGAIDLRINSSHAVIISDEKAKDIPTAIEAFDPALQVMSHGEAIEIYKEAGRPEEVAGRFGVNRMQGSHMIGHTRMATESAVTTAGSHPFSTGADLCLVHNGSLSNHNRLRDRLRDHEGLTFRTENDTEVGAAFIAHRLQQGRSLHQAFEDCLEALDGFYTFVAGTRDGFAVLRDPIACKPAVLAETEGYVAFASEYQALTALPGIEQADVWEPEPATVYSWGGHA